ncbi:MAG: glutamate racemase [Anaerolineales bacterium]|jgi:glutamate racemase
MDQHPLGIFDSGIGGLSVLRHVRDQLPHENLIYLADQAHVPYGPRPLDQVRAFSEEITRYLMAQGAKLIVVACNTASAAALKYLRDNFPAMPFVGMEPAVKPAAETTHNKVVGVLATQATFQGELFASLVERFAKDVIVLEQTLPGLVERIEAGDLHSQATRTILEEAVLPLLQQGADALVLGCTHYPFIRPLLDEIVAGRAEIIDPSPAVARQVGRVLTQQDRMAPRENEGEVLYISSKSSRDLAHSAYELTGITGRSQPAAWVYQPLALHTQIE